MEEGTRQCRLSHRDRPALLQRSLFSVASSARRTLYRDDCRDLPPGRACGHACAQLQSRIPHDAECPSAQVASTLPGMDARTTRPLGGEYRAIHRMFGGKDSSIPPSSRTGLPLVSGNPAFGKNLWSGSTGGRSPSGLQSKRVLLSKYQVDPQDRPRPPDRTGRAAGPASHSSFEYPWNRLLQCSGGTIVMLMQPTLEKLYSMKLMGMAEAIRRQMENP